MATMDAEPRPLEAAWSAWIADHSPEILRDPLLHDLALASRRALGERAAEIARLKAQLDGYLGRQVQHCTSANAAVAGAVLIRDRAPLGTLLRATDTGQEWELTATGWEPRT